VQAALARHAEQQLPWNTDEMQQIKLLVDGQRHFVMARRRAERDKIKSAQAAVEMVKAAPEPLPGEAARQEAVNAYRARIPEMAYSTSVGDLNLNPRVLEHIERSGLTNVGQIHERLATGDEAMLAIDGIGPKGLAHIKQAIDDKGLGLKPVAVEAAPVGESALVEQPIEPQPAVEPSVAEEKPAAEVAAEAPIVEAPAAAVEAQPLAAAQPEAAAQPQAAVAQPAGQPEGEAVAVAPTGPIDIEEIEDEEELERKGGKKKGKRKDRTLVFDEARGMVIAKKQRKAGRGKDVFDFEEES
jgi:hypothetical protein